VSVDELIAEMRPTPRGGTPHRKLIRALRSRGFACGDRFIPCRGKPLPHSAVVRITHPKGIKPGGHVVVKIGRTWFDPALDAPFDGEPIRTTCGNRYWVGGSRITSTLWLGDGQP
jgi:hypothetical protein